MIKKLALASVLSFMCYSTYADDDVSPGPQFTSAVPNARYEIVQSPLAAKWTFRIDRHAGRVWQLVKTASDGLTWEAMEVVEGPKVASPGKARFQIFTSGLAARHTYLIDTDTGKTWQLAGGKKKKDSAEADPAIWQPLE